MLMLRIFGGVLAALFMLIVSPTAMLLAAEDEYQSLEEIDALLEAWSHQHSQMVSVKILGRSAGDHPVRIARVAAPGPIPAEDRPAIFIGGNIVGHHNAASEAVLHFGEHLLENAESIDLQHLTVYLAPALNPDAHDAFFASPSWPRSANDQPIDRDRDGLEGEDGFDDLNGDGKITWMRILDPLGEYLPHPEEPRLMVKADASRGWVGQYRLLREGHDNDGDGVFNEDGPGGIELDRNFAHAFTFSDPAFGLWPGHAPEVYTWFEFFTTHPEITLAVIFGPANNLLALPSQLGPSPGEPGKEKFKLPTGAAGFLGLDDEEEYTADEVWEVARFLSFVKRNNITKEQFIQFLGVGPANKLSQEDQALLEKLSKGYKVRLEEAGLDVKRPAAQYTEGGFTPWLYYQAGVLAIEVDVWGIPKAEKKEDGGEEKPALSVDALAEMSSEDFLALGEEAVANFLKEIGAPPQITAAGVIQRVESGQVTPAQMAGMMRQMGAGGGGGETAKEGEDSGEIKRQREVLAWIDAHAPDAFTSWTETKLPDGRTVEVGGLDPHIERSPPFALLEPALAAHSAWLLDLALQMPRLEVIQFEAKALGGGVYQVEAAARNVGEWATHTQMSTRARNRLPVRLKLDPGDAQRLNGPAQITSERLVGTTGTISGQWLLQGSPGTEITIEVMAPSTTSIRQTLTLGKEVR